jgi:hypothetical protein
MNTKMEVKDKKTGETSLVDYVVTRDEVNRPHLTTCLRILMSASAIVQELNSLTLLTYLLFASKRIHWPQSLPGMLLNCQMVPLPVS